MPEIASKLVRISKTDVTYQTHVIDSYRRTKTYKAGGTISAGNVVATDQSQSTGLKKMQTVVACPTSASGEAGYGGIKGVALTDAIEGEDVEVIVAGIALGVDCSGTVSSGDELVADLFGGDVGHCRALALDVASTGILVAAPFAYALSVSSGGKCTIDIYPRGI